MSFDETLGDFDTPSIVTLCAQLTERSGPLHASQSWPSQQLRLCAENNVFRWFIPKEYEGWGFRPSQIVKGYRHLAAACLTTTFVISQRNAACKRIVSSENEDLKKLLLPQFADGSLFTTVGISHLTTSHRHVGKPVLTATESGDDWVLNGFCPWVTGGAYADFLVVGANVNDQQVLLAVPGDLDGVRADAGFQLVALTASQTGRVNFDNVRVSKQFVLGGPTEAVLQLSPATNSLNRPAPTAGGLETSALALGLAAAAISYISEQSATRSDLQTSAEALLSELAELEATTVAVAEGQGAVSKEQLRVLVNSFVLRATQSALLAAKGVGFVEGHCVGRWCKEAMFFLVWSCPQVVRDANLCELAGLESF